MTGTNLYLNMHECYLSSPIWRCTNWKNMGFYEFFSCQVMHRHTRLPPNMWPGEQSHVLKNHDMSIIQMKLHGILFRQGVSKLFESMGQIWPVTFFVSRILLEHRMSVHLRMAIWLFEDYSSKVVVTGTVCPDIFTPCSFTEKAW